MLNPEISIDASLLTARFQVPIQEDTDKAARSGARRRRSTRTGQARPVLHPPFRWRLLENALTEQFGGWTRLAGTAEGEWFDPEQGKAVRERSRVYEVDVSEERVGDLEALLRRCCITFVQKCIRLVVDGRARYVKEESNDEPL